MRTHTSNKFFGLTIIRTDFVFTHYTESVVPQIDFLILSCKCNIKIVVSCDVPPCNLFYINVSDSRSVQPSEWKWNQNFDVAADSSEPSAKTLNFKRVSYIVLLNYAVSVLGLYSVGDGWLSGYGQSNEASLVFLTLEDGTDTLSRNVGKRLPLNAT
jgi:hypothetical protein